MQRIVLTGRCRRHRVPNLLIVIVVVGILALFSGQAFGAASYPSTVFSFVTHLTGDIIQAADVNAPDNEIVAIESGLLNGVQHALKPLTDATYTLGTSALRWTQGWFSGYLVVGGTVAPTDTSGGLSLGGRAQTGTANRFRFFQSMVEIEQNVAQSLSSGGSGTVVAFTAGATVNVNTDTVWASGNPTRETAQIAGKYEASAFCTFPIQSSGNGLAAVFFRKNGTTTLPWQQTSYYPSGGSTASIVSGVSGPISLAATDYLEVMAYQSSSASQTLGSCGFGMLYIGE